MKISVPALKKLIFAMNSSPVEFVDMGRPDYPEPGQCGCFAWLGHIALNVLEVPLGYEDKDGCYRQYYDTSKTFFQSGEYNYVKETGRISNFLFPEDVYPLNCTDDYMFFPFELWAHHHPELWGNSKGAEVFCEPEAFVPQNAKFLKISYHFRRELEGGVLLTKHIITKHLSNVVDVLEQNPSEFAIYE